MIKKTKVIIVILCVFVLSQYLNLQNVFAAKPSDSEIVYDFNDVDSNGTIFVGIGKDGLIATSEDGIIWSEQKSNTYNTLRDIVWDGSKFIVVGEKIICKSLDGVNWTIIYEQSADFLFVASNGEKIVVLDEQNSYTSVDEKKWKKTDVLKQIPTGIDFTALTYGNGLFVAASRSTLCTSTDGDNWKVIANNGVFNDWFFKSITYGKLGFAACGWRGGIAYSKDGVSWQKAVDINEMRNMVGVDSNKKAGGLVQDILGSIIWDGEKYITAGYFYDSGQISTSNDMKRWTFKKNIPEASYHLAKNKDYIIGVGMCYNSKVVNGVLNLSGNVVPTVIRSRDGVNWETGVIRSELDTPKVARNRHIFVKLLQGGNVAVSEDGKAWEEIRVSDFTLNSVFFFNGFFYAAGKNGSLVRSSDGKTWTKIDTGSTENFNVLASSGSHLILAGDNGKIISSRDMKNFIEYSYKDSNIKFKFAASQNGSAMVVSESGVFLWTGDGLNWNEVHNNNQIKVTSFEYIKYDYGYYKITGIDKNEGVSVIVTLEQKGNAWISRRIKDTSGVASDPAKTNHTNEKMNQTPHPALNSGQAAHSKAVPTTSKVLVNGIPAAFEAYTINGSNYFKLRDLAKAVNGTKKQFEVSWDSWNEAISLLSNKAYTVVGNEMTIGDGKEKEAILNSSTVYKDGVRLRMSAYTINGYNYFRLRDIAQVFDISVTWDDATNTIHIDTNTAYNAP